jgi:hypothetical protein
MEMDIKSDSVKNHETWNDCPECKRTWKDAEPTPGLIHRTRLCYWCLTKKTKKTKKKAH